VTNPSWFINEVGHAGRENLDAAHVAAYDAKEDARAAEEVALLRDLGLTADSTVVEFGPGTGQLTVEVAPACARVAAVDVSAPMLDRLRAKVAERGLENVELVQAGLLSYDREPGSVDVVYSRLALHHIPDFWKVLALERLRRMLRPGGFVRLVDVVYDFEPAEAAERIEAWCARYEGAAAGQWTRADVEEHVRDEHSTFSWLMEPMIRRCGFEIAAAEHSDDGVFAAYVLRLD